MVQFDAILQSVLPLLNAGSTADLVWWTAAEMYDLMHEASRRLGRIGATTEVGLIAPVAAGPGAYPLPARTLSLAMVAAGGVSVEGTSAQELEALDETWQETTGTPAKWLTDVYGPGQISLYPAPTAETFIGFARHTYFDVLGAGAIARGPKVFEDMLKYDVLEQARSKPGSGSMPDVAKAAAERLSLYRQVFGSYWEEAE